MKRYKRYIKIIITSDTGRSESTIKSPHVTERMIQAARDAVYTMCTDKLAPRAKPARRRKRTPAKRPEARP